MMYLVFAQCHLPSLKKESEIEVNKVQRGVADP